VRYITITANTFDEAVQIARNQYGSLLRIHSRRDVIGKKKFLFGKKKSYVELTCYIAEKKVEEEPLVEVIEEEVAVTLETELLSEKEFILQKGRALLEANGFSTTFNDAVLNS
jgi:flagellar biosynthesis GTPase FlhF